MESFVFENRKIIHFFSNKFGNIKYILLFCGMKKLLLIANPPYMKKSSNRAQSWSKAKKTGHLNENNVCQELGKGFSTSNRKVESIFGDKTPPKTDIYGKFNLSLKKSLGGQVHMNTVRRWILGFELIYGEIPENVKKVFLILFGGYQSIDEILSSPEYVHPNPKIRKTEVRRKTLTIETLEKYDSDSLTQFISWIEENICNIAELVFKKGWAKNSEDWASILWYKNSFGENNIDQKFDIQELIFNCQGKKVSKGTKNGGTTIQLPFGHIQFHQGGLQFHHNFEKINKLFTN